MVWIFLIIIAVVVASVVYSQAKRSKQLFDDGKIVKRDGVFWENEEL